MPSSGRKVLAKATDTKLNQRYRLGKVLGKGAFGTVFLAEDIVEGKPAACKSIDKSKLVCQEDYEDVVREVEILNLVSDHEHVAELYDTYEDDKAVHMVLELCKGGELFDRIISKGTFTEKMAADYFRTMVLVINHLHQLGVMHRDIKPENFLLTSSGDDAKLKLCDFGLSSYIKPGQKLQHVVGSAYYVAPEVLRRNYSKEADIWSLGVMLYILLSGLPPFWGDTEEEIFRMVLKGDVDFKTAPWPSISNAAKDIVRKLLTPEPGKRPTAQDILEHPWLKEQGVAKDEPLDSVVLTRMRNFANMNKLKKAALLYIAKNINSKDISGLRELFKSIDADGNGTITAEELKVAISKLSSKEVQDADLLSVMEKVDVDKSGQIDYEEFIAATVNLHKLEREHILLEAFKHFDTDSSGSLSTDEIREGLAKFGVTESEISELVEKYDTNKDGMIDYDEFLALMKDTAKDDVKEGAQYFRNRLTRVSQTVAPSFH
eukprot:jgi/Botrbrau1/13628/Bobra.0373s0007.1